MAKKRRSFVPGVIPSAPRPIDTGAPGAVTATNDTVTIARLDLEIMNAESRAYQLLALIEGAQKQLGETNARILELRRQKAALPA